MNETTYATLDDALVEVAGRSFHKDALVTPRGDGTYTVEDTHSHARDEWVWSYDRGIHDTDSVSEVSRLMDPAELYATAGHIRYNMAESVEALEAGTHAVTFAYVTVDVDDLECEDAEMCEDAGHCVCDRLVGWALVAEHWKLDDHAVVV